MFDIITFGSGTNDVYFISEDLMVVEEKKFLTKKGLCLSLGSKIEVKDILFKIGGGGTNTAHTFRKQGFKVAWCGMVDKDFASEKIINELKKAGVETSFISRTDKKLTNYSIILTAPNRERTILVYRGASGELRREDIPWQKLKAKWFYLAPLSGKLANLFEEIVNFARKNKIKVAANPGDTQLSLPKTKLKRILKKIDILILNQEEASALSKVPYKEEKEIFKKLDNLVPGICIMTKGPEGVVVSDGEYLYTAPALKEKILDRTGAGDAFSSGFLSGFIKNKSIPFAIQLGVANAASCLKKWGAKEGLLNKNQKYPRVKVGKVKCNEETKVCQDKF